MPDEEWIALITMVVVAAGLLASWTYSKGQKDKNDQIERDRQLNRDCKAQKYLARLEKASNWLAGVSDFLDARPAGMTGRSWIDKLRQEMMSAKSKYDIASQSQSHAEERLEEVDADESDEFTADDFDQAMATVESLKPAEKTAYSELKKARKNLAPAHKFASRLALAKQIAAEAEKWLEQKRDHHQSVDSKTAEAIERETGLIDGLVAAIEDDLKRVR